MKRLVLLTIMITTTASLVAQTDMHCHIVTPQYLATLERHHALMDEGFPIPHWDSERHLAFMDRAGIATSVLTLPAPQPWFGDTKEAAAVCRSANETCAMLKARHPGRFRFCAALPLPDMQAAISEARYALDVLGADGVKLATNAYGQYLGDPALDSLMAFLDERHTVVIIHPHKPSAVNSQLIADVPLASYEYLAETSRALLNMIAHNIMVRYPHIKIIVPHCGSFLPTALPRFRSLLPAMVAQGIMQPVDVDAQLANLYYDLAGAPTDEVIDMLLTITTPAHLLYGSDYPYVAEPVLEKAKQSLAARLPLHGIDPEEVMSLNARRLFGEQVPPAPQGARITRLAEIEVEPALLDRYLQLASEVGRTSMATEPGVLALLSMQDKQTPTKIYILEIYADSAAYQSHIQTPHFKHYKESTATMVRSLRLIDTTPLVPVQVKTPKQ